LKMLITLGKYQYKSHFYIFIAQRVIDMVARNTVICGPYSTKCGFFGIKATNNRKLKP
jgi:hypothetical protein